MVQTYVGLPQVKKKIAQSAFVALDQVLTTLVHTESRKLSSSTSVDGGKLGDSWPSARHVTPIGKFTYMSLYINIYMCVLYI